MTCFEKICGIASEVVGLKGEAIATEEALGRVQLGPLDLEEVILEVEELFDVIVDREDEICNLRELVAHVEAQLECA